MPDQTGMPLIIRYDGSWLRFFSIGPGIFGLLITALLVQLWFNPQPNMNRAFFSWAWILPSLFLLFTASDLAAKVRFRLAFDGQTVKYRGIFRESSLAQAEIARLSWAPAARYTPGSLRFYDANDAIVMSIDPTLLSTIQLAEISRVMDIPIEGPPAR
jgi:hypothetical protein